jgi:hypothetical protein
MSSRRVRKPSIQAVIALLNDPEFAGDARRVIAEGAAVRAQAPMLEGPPERVLELGHAFLARWGILPPPTGELLDADPRRRVVEAIASGNWGIVQVFPPTTDREIHARVENIRRAIRRRHKDSLEARKAQLVAWLQDCGAGFDRKAIARAVYGWTKGLSRPTKAQAIARTTRKRETALYQKYRQEYRELGIAEADIDRLAEQRVYRTLRGSEAPANAALRMVESRYFARLQQLNTNLATPIKSEPLSHALTTLFRALDEDNATVRQHAAHAKVVFSGDSVEPLLPGQPSKADSRSRGSDGIESADWGVVPVFPWTTDPDIRALVKSIRTRIRAPRRDGGPPTPPPSAGSEPYSSALRRLFRALAHEDDAAVKRHAKAVLISVLTAFPP